MKISWFPEGGLKFWFFLKMGPQLNYVDKDSTKIHRTIRKIFSGVLNHMEKLNLWTSETNSKLVDAVYPDHVNALRKAGLAPFIFPTMGYLWRESKLKNVDNDVTTDHNAWKVNNLIFFFLLCIHSGL